jgi:alanine racemase
MTLSLPRPVWLEIDLDAVAANFRTVRRLVGPERRIFAVVKADGYGFGAAETAAVFAAEGADALALADLAEAIRLRERGLTLPILLYPSALPDVAADVLAWRVTPTVTDVDSARAYSEAATEPCGLFVKVDVGLQRLGVAVADAVKTIAAIAELPRIRVEGVCTHLHVRHDADPAYIDWQFSQFTGVIDDLGARGIQVPIRLAASSPLVLRHPQTYLNAVDPGHMLYGVYRTESSVPLAPALRGLKTRLITVKDLAPRERFAADGPFPVPAPMRLGVIPTGSSDGMLSLHADRVLVRGRSVPVVAGPSLEHTRVDLTSVPDARVGDEVVIIGRQGDAEITLAEVARRRGLDPVQVTLAVGRRVARVYFSSGQVVNAPQASRSV